MSATYHSDEHLQARLADGGPNAPSARIDPRPLAEIAKEQEIAWTRVRHQSANPSLPVVPREKKRVVIQRATPTVAGMLDDAYASLAKQLHQFRNSAHVEEWDSAKAGAFGKLVSSLVSLQETERRNAASYAMGELSDAELQALAEKAKRFLTDSHD